MPRDRETTREGEPTVGDFLTAVEEELNEAIERLHREVGRDRDESSRVLGDAAEHLTLAPAAKRARPQLVYHFGRLVGVEPEELVNFAVATELVHTASLLHDDVVDSAEERRGRDAANARWGNTVAVLAGDSVLCESLRLVHAYGQAFAGRSVEVVAEMTRGIMQEVEARGRIDLEIDDWRRIADGKTAVLFGWCGWGAAMARDDSETAERLERCGRHLGLAFQIADDLKDLTGETNGKGQFMDLRTRFPSYPLIQAMNDSVHLKAQIERLWRGDERSDVERIGHRILRSEAVGATREALSAEVQAALEALGEDAEQPGGGQIAGWAKALRAEFAHGFAA